MPKKKVKKVIKLEKKKETLPDSLYVVKRDSDGIDGYFVATDNLEDIDREEVVGVYDLVSTGKKDVTHYVDYGENY